MVQEEKEKEKSEKKDYRKLMIVANKVKLLKRSHLICHKEQTRLKEKKKTQNGLSAESREACGGGGG